MGNELTRIEPQSVAQVPSDDPQSLIAMAIEKGVPLGDLVAMRREWKAEKAKEAFDAAMAAFQAECPTIYKTTPGGTTKGGTVAYKFASFEDIIAQVKPLLLKHGFSFKLGTDIESKDGWVIATCKVTHSGGHSEESEAKFPLGTKTDIMSQTQVYAAALSFASRRVFMNALGLVAASEDMDGRLPQRTHGPSKISTIESLQKELWELLKPVRGADWTSAKKWLFGTGVLNQDEHQISKLSAERLTQIIDESKIQLAKEAE